MSTSELDKFSTQTRSSVDEWEQHLKEEAGKSNWDSWEINHKHITYDKLELDSLSDCDIVILYSSTPPDLSFWGILGLAMSDYDTGKTVIEIYYSVPDLCDSGERKKEGNIIYIIQVPCYGDMMVSDQLGGVVRHEMGHGFGLGHYMSADETLMLEWNDGLSPTPSVMVRTSYANSDELRISPKDIEKLMGIYGEDGFILNSNEEKNLLLENPNQPEQEFVDLRNEEFGFSFEYPEKWGVDDNIEISEDFTGVLYVEDEDEGLNRSFEVGFYPRSIVTGSNDEAILEELIDNEMVYCKEILAKDNFFDCENILLLETKTHIGPNGKVYTIKYIWNDGVNHQFVQRNYQFSGNKVWEVSGYGVLAPFLLTSNVMEYSINSFKLENIEDSDNLPVPEPEDQFQFDSPSLELELGTVTATKIPDWVRGNADWWAQGAIGDADFVSGIQYLITEGIMTIPETSRSEGGDESQVIPSWIKNNADWWAKGLITDDDFVKGIQYLVENGILVV